MGIQRAAKGEDHTNMFADHQIKGPQAVAQLASGMIKQQAHLVRAMFGQQSLQCFERVRELRVQAAGRIDHGKIGFDSFGGVKDHEVHRDREGRFDFM